MTVKVNLIGAGRVGQTFLRLLNNVNSVAVGDVLSRSYSSALRAAASVGAGRAVRRLEDMEPAQLWLIAVPDDQIAAISEKMSRLLLVSRMEPPVAVHFSGFHSSDMLKPLRDKGWFAASCHPVLSFPDPASAVNGFKGTYCGTEGDEPAVAMLGPLLFAIGAHAFPIRADRKALYHAAAVFSNNFTVVLQAIAMEAWAQSGVPLEVAEVLCSSLLGSASTNVLRLGPQAALTGPAARSDQEVMRLQRASVSEWYAEAGEVYDRLSKMAHRLKLTGTTGPEMWSVALCVPTQGARHA
ncbi:Rossmann-like and DUF2520 domain-containing protein [Mesorhizobium sp. 2RAF21]|uniref:Rossmann-like and DUF2520 domain-containing protein n=1 Tax=Mesorhizobium sp. 2RAF21 TaxID=3232995 RepID=UPI003F9EA423